MAMRMVAWYRSLSTDFPGHPDVDQAAASMSKDSLNLAFHTSFTTVGRTKAKGRQLFLTRGIDRCLLRLINVSSVAHI